MKNIFLFSILFFALGCDSDDEMPIVETPIISNDISITGMSVLDYCGEPHTSYDFTIEVNTENGLQDNKDFSGTVPEAANLETTVTGNDLEVLIRLNNFEDTDLESGKGSGFDDIIFTHFGDNDDTLYQENLGVLFICTDSVYELNYSYDFEERTSSLEVKTHGF